MQKFSFSLSEIINGFWRNRGLIKVLVKREVVGRYRGSIIGLAWSFLNPLLMLAVYTLIFSGVFNSRWSNAVHESKFDFAAILFVGLMVHGVFSECINRAPGLIVSNVSYVKKVVFPLEILPWVVFGAALFHMLVSFVVLLMVQAVFNQKIPLTAFLFPVVLLPLILGTMGVSWFLAAIGVYLRDVGQVASMFSTVMLFVSAVFFPISALPEKYQVLLQLNPLAVVIEESRKVLISGVVPDFVILGKMLLVGAILAWAGFAWFQMTRKGFADVL
ncbi:ABC transporter permease [Pseudomonas sp. Fl5BN2]|uniref:ABC transporter permease n=1 Tax=Pseudomonas sp. Fl5BN2 TaxID=2697652 RepID=UPI0013782DA7|nr:ABC transporter permease [Pseudomonas sp. Fl5BN2]NBF03408.1 ABC transporter permease [Pseudomonas sp. Fl5BN2]